MISETELRQAIDNGALTLRYLPVVELEHSRTVGVEALIRLQQGDDLLPPAEFLPVAEASGQMVTLGNWVVKEACQQLVNWQSIHVPDLAMGINISSTELSSEGFCGRCIESAADAGIATDRLSLEISARAIDADKRLLDVIEELRASDIRVAMDNYGPGYADVAWLDSVNVDSIKLDRQVLSGLESDADSKAFVSEVVARARRNRFALVAEGVETVEQMEMLEQLRCPQMQGFFFDQPLKPDDFAAMFETF